MFFLLLLLLFFVATGTLLDAVHGVVALEELGARGREEHTDDGIQGGDDARLIPVEPDIHSLLARSRRGHDGRSRGLGGRVHCCV